MGIYGHRIIEIKTELESLSLLELEGLIDYSAINDNGAGIQVFDFKEIEDYIKEKGEELSPKTIKMLKNDIEKSKKEGKDYLEYYFY